MSVLSKITMLGVLAAVGSGSIAEAQQVGVITAHNTNATSVLPNGKRSIVELGKSVFYNQSFRTDANGRVQARLIDGSSFTLSANSSLTIDSFVYDPADSSGKIVASVAEGVVQFIGGALSKSPDQVTIETNIASLGIRGGIAIIRVSKNESESEFSFHYGKELKIRLKNGKSYRLSKPGTSLRVNTTNRGAIGSAKIGPMSARHLGAVKALKGRVQNKQLAAQRKSILKQKIEQGGLTSELSSGATLSKARLSIKKVMRSKRRISAKNARKRMIRRRRKLN